MNQYYYERNNKAHILDEKEHERIEGSKDNLEEILIIENNIEDIENQIKNLKQTNEGLNNELKLVKIFNRFMIIVACLLPIYPILISDAIAFVIFLATGCATIFTVYKFSKDYKNLKEQYKSFLEVLEVDLDSEIKKLELLKSKSKDKTVEFTAPKKIQKGPMKKELEHKYRLLGKYIENKKTHLEYYQNNCISELTNLYGYSQSDINFLELVMEADIKNEEVKTKKNNKRKIKLYKKNTD